MSLDLSQVSENLLRLQQADRYLAAFIFELQDPFIKVIVDSDNCINLSHLLVNGTPMGISFVSFSQFEQALSERREQNRRPPMLDDAIILFDRTGKLKDLQDKYTATSPKLPEPKDHQMIRFTLLWADNKIRYAIANGDLLSANLSMHTNINDLLKMHYTLNGKWSKNDKRMLADLSIWDGKMSDLLKEFLKQTDIPEKYARWSSMMDYVLEPIGGRFEILNNNCNCFSCLEDLDQIGNSVISSL